MKCPYCKENVALDVWGQHSLECEDRKRVRREQFKRLDSLGLGERAEGVANLSEDMSLAFPFDKMTKDELIEYLESEGIEHDSKAKKKELLKLAKGE